VRVVLDLCRDSKLETRNCKKIRVKGWLPKHQALERFRREAALKSKMPPCVGCVALALAGGSIWTRALVALCLQLLGFVLVIYSEAAYDCQPIASEEEGSTRFIVRYSVLHVLYARERRRVR
jgi:hypothetical protein